MRKFHLLGTAALIGIIALASPALAQGGGRGAGQGPGQGAGRNVSQPAGPQGGQGAGTMAQDRDVTRDRLYLGAQDRFRDFDRDRDGKLTKAEFKGWHDGAYKAMDANGDGLTLEEYQAARLGPGPKAGLNAARRDEMMSRAQERKAVRFQLMDGDGDGVVTRTEYEKFGNLNFLDADANDDGVLTQKEMQKFHRNM